jgi:hypothetical protein
MLEITPSDTHHKVGGLAWAPPQRAQNQKQNNKDDETGGNDKNWTITAYNYCSGWVGNELA